MIKAVIFDLDGVLTDTAVHHYHSWKAIAARFDYELSVHDNEQLKGVSRAKSLDLILQWAGKEIDQEEKNRLLHLKNEHYLQLIESLDQRDILPGVVSFLDNLEQSNCALAVGSSSKNARFILDKLGLKDRFQAIIDGNGVKKTKPDPEVFLNAAIELGLNPSECVVVEDAPSGIIAAKTAGMFCIGVGLEPLEADLLVPTLEGLTYSDLPKN